MDPRPVPPPHDTPAVADLDRTDELPVLDPTAYETRESAAAGDAAVVLRAADDPLQTAAANLRQAQDLLAGRTERLRALEISLQEAQAARAAAEQRAAALGEELTRASAAAAELAARHAAELADGRAAAEQLQRSQDRKSQQALAEKERAHAAAVAELRVARERLTRFHEALQSAERSRGLRESLLTQLHLEADAHETQQARLARELSGHETRAGELESQLVQRANRVAALEQQLGALDAARAQRDAEMQRVLAEQASLRAALEAGRAAAAAAAAGAAGHEAAAAEARGRLHDLETSLAGEKKRSGELEAELTTVRAEMEEWASALRAAQQERSAQQATAERTRELEVRLAAQEQELRSVRASAAAADERARELEARLEVATAITAQLQARLRSRDARVDELERANRQWREALEGARASGDSGSHRALRDAQPAAAEAEDGRVQAPAPDGSARLLIRTDGERELVHVLGRKTSIGRTPDNDLQLDAKFISRHHCVILAGPAHTIIEDLNSTNGVLVNGRRIGRQVLKDGDTLVIGRTEYRFALRRTGERR